MNPASRRRWSSLSAALPAFALSLWFANVLLYPLAGVNGEWAEDAKLLVGLEFLLLFVAALTVWIAAHVSVVRRVAAMSALASPSAASPPDCGS